MNQRFLALRAGPFRVALPLTAVRQILDMGGSSASAPMDPRALGVTPVSLARVFESEPVTDHPALLLFEAASGPLLLTACSLEGVIDGAAPRPLPPTVALRFGGMFSGTLRRQVGPTDSRSSDGFGAAVTIDRGRGREPMLLAINPGALVEVVQARLVEMEASS